MRILHTVEFYEPTKGGAEAVIKQISERLVRRGHNVTVATSYHPARNTDIINGVHIKEFKIKGNIVKGISGEKNEYCQFLRKNQFDIIFNYAAQTWHTDLIWQMLPEIKAKKIIAPLGYSKLHDKRYRNYFEKLPSYLKQYDKILYTSENYQDKLFGDAHGVNDRAMVVANGADEKEFQKSILNFKNKYNISTKYMFISVSNHYFGKGHNFLIKAIRQLRGDDFTLVIIGERPQAHGWYSCYPSCRTMATVDSRVKVLRNVPRDWVVSAYQEANLFLFGSRVECAPLVMYESFAANLPFITRDVGNIKDHRDYLHVIEQPQDLVEQIMNYIRDPQPFLIRAQRAREMLYRFHTWEHLTAVYENIYKDLISS